MQPAAQNIDRLSAEIAELKTENRLLREKVHVRQGS